MFFKPLSISKQKTDPIFDEEFGFYFADGPKTF